MNTIKRIAVVAALAFAPLAFTGCHIELGGHKHGGADCCKDHAVKDCPKCAAGTCEEHASAAGGDCCKKAM